MKLSTVLSTLLFSPLMAFTQPPISPLSQSPDSPQTISIKNNSVINTFDTTATATNYEIAGTESSRILVTDNSNEAVEGQAGQFEWIVDADKPWGGFVSIKFYSNEFLPDMSQHTHLSLWYNNMVASDQLGNVVLRVQLHEYSEGSDQEEVWVYETKTVLEATPGWTQLLIPLDNRGAGVEPNDQGFSNPGWNGVAGNNKLDYDKVREYEFAFSAFQQWTISRGTLLLDNLELYGTRETDVSPPPAPLGVNATASAQNYFNAVSWQDVPGESNETYTVYASLEPIANLSASKIEVVAAEVERGEQTVIHYLTYPLIDQETSYYYAVTATDAAGNISEPRITAVPTTNLAKGIATISLNPPANFAADGDLSEWELGGIVPFVLRPSTDKITTGAFSNDDDLIATVYLAIDNQYLYVAADVFDDVFSFDSQGNWWEDDALEMFIGFYNQSGAQHRNYNRGEEPDYRLLFRNDGLINSGNDAVVIHVPEARDYFFAGSDLDWRVETRIKLTDIAFGNDRVLVPQNGMRIPIDLVVHDSDQANTRAGALAFSQRNDGNSSQCPCNWAHSWIGNQPFITSVAQQEHSEIPLAYRLGANYPNPFSSEANSRLAGNSTTTFEYTLPKTATVKIELFNALGQRVRAFVHEVKSAGTYTVRVDADDLTSGIYFYRMATNDFQQTKKMILMR